jgi:hypothetical protein
MPSRLPIADRRFPIADSRLPFPAVAVPYRSLFHSSIIAAERVAGAGEGYRCLDWFLCLKKL